VTSDPAAVWTIRFRCGHRQRRSLDTVPGPQRTEKAALIARGLCTNCRRIVDTARHRAGQPL
jgi:hypothetical protein